jgi:hypothetical protein
MKLPAFLNLYAIILLGAGIAFAIYGPLMLAFFTIPDQLASAQDYWYVASFARMFGAALFGMGLLVWSLRSVVDGLPPQIRRGVLAALLLANLMAAFVAITQQSSIWLTPAGWVITIVFTLFLLGCGYFLIKQPATTIAA